MARRYTRDARGRFASGGFSGQTGGRGARLMAKGTRAGGGARIKAAPPAGSFRRGQVKPPAKPAETTASRAGLARGPRLQGVTRARLSGRKMSEGAGLRGKRRQERQQRMAEMGRYMARQGQSPSPADVRALARKPRSEPLTTGGGTLAARSSLRRSRAKLRQSDTPSQRGAVTRASRYTGMAIKRERVSLGQSVQGRFQRGKGRKAGPANNVRPTGSRPLVQRGNNIKPYRPNTVDGKMNQIDRQIDRTMKPLVDDLRNIGSKLQKARPELDAIGRELERMNAKDIANRNKKGIRGQVSRDVLAITGTNAGRKAITRRMQRALGAAGRGSKAGQRAVRVYLDQLAGMGPGKPSKGRNNLRPGPRNTKGTPKRRRKRKG